MERACQRRSLIEQLKSLIFSFFFFEKKSSKSCKNMLIDGSVAAYLQVTVDTSQAFRNSPLLEMAKSNLKMIELWPQT